MSTILASARRGCPGFGILIRGQNRLASATTKVRRTLEDIEEYYSPETILRVLEGRAGWTYRVDERSYHLRDRALICVMYVCAFRIREGLRLKKSRFRMEEKQRVRVIGIPAE